MRPILNAKVLGVRIRAERQALGRTQSWIAKRVGCWRQTIADLEAGKNVELGILFGTLSALGKAVDIVDVQVEVERLDEIFRDEN
jgi:transcriptional regulator with XRE-family HTH domain